MCDHRNDTLMILYSRSIPHQLKYCHFRHARMIKYRAYNSLSNSHTVNYWTRQSYGIFHTWCKSFPWSRWCVATLIQCCMIIFRPNQNYFPLKHACFLQSSSPRIFRLHLFVVVWDMKSQVFFYAKIILESTAIFAHGTVDKYLMRTVFFFGHFRTLQK